MNWQSWGLAWARIRDTLTATGGTGAGKIRMQWRVSAAHDLHNDAVNPLVIFDITREVKLDFRCYINPNFAPDCGNPVLVWEQSGPIDELLTFDLPIVFGAPLSFAYWIELSATSGFRSNYCETQCIVSFHGASTTEASAELVAVELYDGVGNLLDPSGITSESGFRYDLVTAPEPSAAAAAAPVLAALLALARTRWRRELALGPPTPRCRRRSPAPGLRECRHAITIESAACGLSRSGPCRAIQTRPSTMRRREHEVTL